MWRSVRGKEHAVRRLAGFVGIGGQLSLWANNSKAVIGVLDNPQWGGTIVAVALLVVLGNTFAEFRRARQFPPISLFRQEFNMWLPNDCPLCAAGGIPDHLAHN